MTTVHILLAQTSLAIAIGGCLLAQSLAYNRTIPKRRPTNAQILELPITISASLIGHFAIGESWTLSVNSGGIAALTTHSMKDSDEKIQISEERLSELRHALVQHSFFEIPSLERERPLDSSYLTVCISVGPFVNSVVSSGGEASRDHQRKIAVFNLISGWVDKRVRKEEKKSGEYDAITSDANE